MLRRMLRKIEATPSHPSLQGRLIYDLFSPERGFCF